MCFEGNYRSKAKIEKNSKNDSDIFNMIASALSLHISYSDLGNMSFVMLSNICDAILEGQSETEEERQKRLDAIT